MSLTDLFLMLKGGPGSGNWGHAGRPGKRGGSAPGGGLSSIGAETSSTVDERRYLSLEFRKNLTKVKKGKDLVFKNKITRPTGDTSQETFDNLSKTEEGRKILQFANALEDYKDLGVDLSVDNIMIKGNRIQVVIGATNNKGESVATMTRNFYPKSGIIENTSFKVIHSQYKDKGFGSKFYKITEEAYMDMGYKKVRLEANLTVGGYAWARMGYGFSEPVPAVKDRFRKVYARRYDEEPPSIPERAYEMAAYTGPDNFPIGKSAMLGTGWMGEKSLDVNSEGWKIGQAYYASKGLT